MTPADQPADSQETCLLVVAESGAADHLLGAVHAVAREAVHVHVRWRHTHLHVWAGGHGYGLVRCALRASADVLCERIVESVTLLLDLLL